MEEGQVQGIHSRIGDARRDFLHETSAAISKNHGVECAEDLQVRNMSKSAAGTTEMPGRNVRAKSGLNKAILDQGWFEFRRPTRATPARAAATSRRIIAESGLV